MHNKHLLCMYIYTLFQYSLDTFLMQFGMQVISDEKIGNYSKTISTGHRLYSGD